MSCVLNSGVPSERVPLLMLICVCMFACKCNRDVNSASSHIDRSMLRNFEFGRDIGKTIISLILQTFYPKKRTLLRFLEKGAAARIMALMALNGTLMVLFAVQKSTFSMGPSTSQQLSLVGFAFTCS